MWLDPPGKPSPLIRDTFLNATEKLLDLCFKKGKKDADFEFIEGKNIFCQQFKISIKALVLGAYLC